MPVTGTGVRPVTSARRLSVAASRAGSGSTWAPVCRPDSGWAGTNQNIFHAILHLDIGEKMLSTASGPPC